MEKSLKKIIEEYEGNSIADAEKLFNDCEPKLNIIESKKSLDEDVITEISSALSEICINTITSILNVEAKWASDGFKPAPKVSKGSFINYTSPPKWELVNNYKSSLKRAIALINKLSKLNLNSDSKRYLEKNKKIIIQNELDYKNESGFSKEDLEAFQTLSGENINKSKSSCYIATMAYGDINHPKVETLRRFRDNVLINKRLGILFINYYYKFSPFLVSKLKNYKRINIMIRRILDKLIENIKMNEKNNINN